MDRLFAYPAADLYLDLGFNPGFAPQLQVSPYVKLLPMLAGVGSPGTIQEVGGRGMGAQWVGREVRHVD